MLNDKIGRCGGRPPPSAKKYYNTEEQSDRGANGMVFVVHTNHNVCLLI